MKKMPKKWIKVAVIGWVSFMSASLATMVFFATFDPEVLVSIATFPMAMESNTGYGIGFFLFWILLVINGAIIVWLLDLPSRNNEKKHSVVDTSKE